MTILDWKQIHSRCFVIYVGMPLCLSLSSFDVIVQDGFISLGQPNKLAHLK